MKAEELAVYAQNTGVPSVLIGTLVPGRVPEIIATMKGGPADRIRALRLVKCWNCHDELLAALTDLAIASDTADLFLRNAGYTGHADSMRAKVATAKSILAKAK